MDIPEEAVEAARSAYLKHPKTRGMDSSANSFRAALEAAAPFIAAQALRDEADRLGGMADSTDKSPYVSAGRDIIKQIRNRADEIEAGN